ncbi:MAG TPA: translesion error-prone DNA polymerase V autoproteolytic subunit [Candidatus Krumholzibacteria bacterium]|nr:translesion error-prone DNA polymerase V autoproteolytic subunit [Candidatus Krumholzibacteria bacterium]HRX51614.1 translesion error-prone DNA polymerase V autoproteolytic subunit [Candidatus Krumholzibacteria bacterium]
MAKKTSGSSHGGARPGAGRPRGTGRYGEPTQPMRIPESLVVPIQEILDARARNAEARPGDGLPHGDNVLLPDFRAASQPLPLFEHRVAAGFPSPADDHMEKRLDLNEFLVKRPASTFFVRVEGLSMINAGIHPDDVLVVDRAESAADGRIVVAAVNGELTVKRLKKTGARLYLMPENPDYKPIEITGDTDLVIWGVVTSVIHKTA